MNSLNTMASSFLSNLQTELKYKKERKTIFLTEGAFQEAHSLKDARLPSDIYTYLLTSLWCDNFYEIYNIRQEKCHNNSLPSLLIYDFKTFIVATRR